MLTCHPVAPAEPTQKPGWHWEVDLMETGQTSNLPIHLFELEMNAVLLNQAAHQNILLSLKKKTNNTQATFQIY